jgi:hypothetical protein
MVVKLPRPARLRADGGFEWAEAPVGAGSLLGAVPAGRRRDAIVLPTPWCPGGARRLTRTRG